MIAYEAAPGDQVIILDRELLTPPGIVRSIPMIRKT